MGELFHVNINMINQYYARLLDCVWIRLLTTITLTLFDQITCIIIYQNAWNMAVHQTFLDRNGATDGLAPNDNIASADVVGLPNIMS